MAYSVYAVEAAEFMAAFYERLFAGDTVSAAVTAGRQRLFRHPGRPSPNAGRLGGGPRGGAGTVLAGWPSWRSRRLVTTEART